MNESVSASDDLRAKLHDILIQVGKLAQRVSGLEELASMGGGESLRTAIAHEVKARVTEPPPRTCSVAAAEDISEEEFLAVSAALAAWLGVHAHIRQIRLIRTGAWAQQGRVTIQASHRPHY